MKVVTVTWQPEQERFEAEGTLRGHTVTLNGPHHGRPTGFSPSELLLASAGSCSAWDVVEILRKKRQDVAAVEVEVAGEQATEPPWPFRRITLTYRVRGRGLQEAAVQRAVQLSVERYCSVLATVRGVARISTEVQIVDAGPGGDAGTEVPQLALGGAGE